MFLLHETTQRRVCRGIFLVGCLLPTLVILGWVAHWHRPWRQSDWQHRLAQQLHIRAETDSVTAPQPGVRAITNLRLADLRTGKSLGTFSKVTLEQQNSRLTLNADHLELQADQLPALVNAFATWLATEEPQPIDLKIDRLTITSPKLQVLQLENLQLHNNASDLSTARFHLLAHDQQKPVKLAVEYDAGDLKANLDLQQAALPAWLVGKLVPGLAGCNEAKFSGVVKAEHRDQQTRGKLHGQLVSVDLQQWSAAAAPHRLQCLCQVQLEELRWQDSAVEFASGKINASSGALSYSIFHALKDTKIFGCGVGSRFENLHVTSWDELIPFDKLAFGFQLSKAGLALHGECQEGALAVAQSAPLLFSPPQGTLLPVAHLVQLLHRAEKGYLPDTLRALEMAKGLPLPGSDKSDEKAIKK